MKKSLAVKLIAIILFVLLSSTAVASVISVTLLAKQQAYIDNGRRLKKDVRDYAESNYRYELHDMIYMTLVSGNTKKEAGFDALFGREVCNYLFEVRDDEGKVVLTNYEGDISGINYRAIYEYEYDPYYEVYAYHGDYENAENVGNYYITAVIPAELVAKDIFYYTESIADWFIEARYGLAVYGVVALLVALILFVFLMCAAGHVKECTEITPNFIDLIPFDLYVGIEFLIFAGTVAFSNEVVNFDEFIFVGIAVVVVAWLVMFISFMMTLATRIKLKTVFKNTVIMATLRFAYRIIKKCWKLLGTIPMFIKFFAIYAGIAIIELIFLSTGQEAVYMTFWLFEKCVFGVGLLLLLNNLKKVFDAGKKLSSGDIDYKIDTEKMFFEFKEHADNLNGIGDGLQNAVEKSLKSERMKAELITNVSHDIKTPLTSIINYVDLLKRDGLDSENAEEYLAVLDRQSARLKKLTEDLIEASKASTGNIKVEAEKLDINILLSQAIGEYEEKFNARRLMVVSDMAEGELAINADGRLLWRIFDNMLNNIVKYAKEDTRVYISTAKVDNKVTIVFKNISDAPLNISSDELMDRFVRGDSSRNTEGSGLGLSIARSLTELMGGRFDISIDGDLFKGSIYFGV